MVQIIPSILSITEEDYARDARKYEQAISLKEGWVHIDFMDDIFVPNKSIGPLVTARYPLNLQKEAHLMVIKPMEWIDDLVKSDFKRIIIHIEAQEVEKCIEYIKGKGLEVGLAINPETSLEQLDNFINRVDVILVMTIVPGFQGQPFIPKTLNKVSEIKNKNWSIKVGVDGAVKDTNIKEIIDVGVSFVIVGSYLLKGDVDENMENLWEVIND